jgi:hypothetical protein
LAIGHQVHSYRYPGNSYTIESVGGFRLTVPAERFGDDKAQSYHAAIPLGILIRFLPFRRLAYFVFRRVMAPNSKTNSTVTPQFLLLLLLLPL